MWPYVCDLDPSWAKGKFQVNMFTEAGLTEFKVASKQLTCLFKDRLQVSDFQGREKGLGFAEAKA